MPIAAPRVAVLCAAVALAFPCPAGAAAPASAKVQRTRQYSGFSITRARTFPKGADKAVAAFEQEADAAVGRSAKAAQALFDHFRQGKHAFGKGLVDRLDLTARQPEDTKSPWIAVGLEDADKEAMDALAKVGLEVSWLRLYTAAKPNAELVARMSAAFLISQFVGGGPLQAIPASELGAGQVPASLVASLDRVTVRTVVQAWRLRERLRPMGLNKEEPRSDGRAEDVARAKVLARLWTNVFDDQPFPEALYDSAERLGVGNLGGVLETMVRASPEARVLEVLTWINKKFRGEGFAGQLELLRIYQAKAFDLPTAEALVQAVVDGDAARVKRLLDAGAPASARDAEKVPAILLALDREKPEIARMLGEAGADLGASGKDERSFFEVAVWKRQAELVKALAPKADFKEKAKAAGERALVQAIRDEDAESAKALLAAGANAQAKTPDKQPLLVYAATAKKGAELCEALLAAGAQVDAKDGDGRTALIAAAEQGRVEAVKVLVARGANIGLKWRGKTAAQLAEAANYPEAAEAIGRR